MESNQQKSDSIEAWMDIMTVHDLAVYLKMSDANIYRMARAGSLPVIRIGKTWRFKKEMIDAWLMKHTKFEFDSN
jgi:excisionase family DNA binding protein